MINTRSTVGSPKRVSAWEQNTLATFHVLTYLRAANDSVGKHEDQGGPPSRWFLFGGPPWPNPKSTSCFRIRCITTPLGFRALSLTFSPSRRTPLCTFEFALRSLSETSGLSVLNSINFSISFFVLPPPPRLG